jgi:hypothetical protein
LWLVHAASWPFTQALMTLMESDSTTLNADVYYYKSFDMLYNFTASLILSCKHYPVQPFVLQRCEERLSQRIIPAHPGPSDRATQVAFRQESVELC